MQLQNGQWVAGQGFCTAEHAQNSLQACFLRKSTNHHCFSQTWMGIIFLTRICSIMCSEQCAILVQIYILSVFKSDWMTKYDNFSSQISFVTNKIISSLMRTFFSHNIYLRCNKINLEIILRSQCSRKKSDWYCMILGLSTRLYNIIIEHK